MNPAIESGFLLRLLQGRFGIFSADKKQAAALTRPFDPATWRPVKSGKLRLALFTPQKRLIYDAVVV
ncbi:MAG TPA: hypothetical protein VN798_16910 [Pseudomonas sp.]|nr:hypothetical protein [Pseudomonas sp.]